LTVEAQRDIFPLCSFKVGSAFVRGRFVFVPDSSAVVRGRHSKGGIARMTNMNLTGMLLVTAVISTAVVADAGDQAKSRGQSGLTKTASNDLYRPMLINNVFNYYSNNGDGSFNKFSSSNEGFEVPKGKDLATVVYEDGVLWGCKQSGTLKVGGSVYRHGLQAGPVITHGTATTLPVADDPANPANRLYRVRRDIRPLPGVTDPDNPLAAGELAIVIGSELPLISRYESTTAEQLLQQYWNDWTSWPAAEGAPYTDVDHNGAYDPAIDIPGVPLADQTIWYVSNDLDPSRTAFLAGSSPIGLEIQKTIWAYSLSGALGNTIFTRTKLINKSGIALDSMYLAQWSDPDVGNAGDDFVGCDTSLSLGYAYNGQAVDASFSAYGLVPPAVGFDLLQGPMVHGAPTDTAMLGSGYRPGFRNLPMTAFAFLVNTSSVYTDPIQGVGGDVQWYRLMKGTIALTGGPFINPLTNQPTPFTLSGDPVTRTGWIPGSFGLGLTPMDYRMVLSSGPFAMAPEDTQEMVVACIASRGADYLSSITALKADVKAMQRVYNSPDKELPPQMSYVVARSANQAAISIRADLGKINATAGTINLKTYGDDLVASVTLADDGLHGDGAAGDGVFGGSVMILQQPTGLQAEAVVTYRSGFVSTWGHVIDNIATAEISVDSYSVASDNLNEDGIPNPGENVRYILTLKNHSSLNFSDLLVSAAPAVPLQQLSLGSLSGNATFAMSYDQNSPATYFAFDVPAAYHDSIFAVLVVTSDLSRNQWMDTLLFPVKPLRYGLHTTPLTHAAGNASGNLEIVIVDSAQLKNHLYVIRGVDTVGPVGGYTLKDSTTGAVLIQNHPLPDSLGHTSPIVDGFKLLRGTIDILPGMNTWAIPGGVRRFSPIGGALFGLEGFSGTIGMAGNFLFGGIGTTLTRPRDYHDVLLNWARVDSANHPWDPGATPTDTNYSLSYRYLRAATADPTTFNPPHPEFLPWIKIVAAGYPYQDYVYGVPFSAWDMSYNPPRRLAVGHFENNQPNGIVDGRYFPALTSVDNGAADGPREMCFIFSSPYTQTPVPPFNTNIANNATMPLMWVLTCARRNDPPYPGNDQFEIIAHHPPSPEDVWTFNPSIITHVEQGSTPVSFALYHNYPNPFNPSTTIRYQLPVPGLVTLRIYNILGQEIRTLVSEIQGAGQHNVIWDSKNDAGSGVASGVYFYLCRAVPINGGAAYSQTMKMLVVR
jgi:hypothetical protein